MANQRVEEAVDSYRQAIECNPKNPEPHNNLGILYAAVGKLDLALEHYREALQLNPRSAIALIEYANGLVMLEGDGMFEQSTRLYQQAAAIEPLDAKEWLDVEHARAELEA